ncbi:MAG: hypothetical protein MZV70_31695 [Desulfobacterales bacterium]|nr:hypothetical protein [Desulfobacterales bacterium]
MPKPLTAATAPESLQETSSADVHEFLLLSSEFIHVLFILFELPYTVISIELSFSGKSFLEKPGL